MTRQMMLIFTLLVALLLPLPTSLAAKVDAPPWSTREQGKVQVHLYFFWSKTCPHCHQARPWLKQLTQRFPWLRVHEKCLTGSDTNVRLYMSMGKRVGKSPQFVPGFLFCGQMLEGFDQVATTGKSITARLQRCYQRLHVPSGTNVAGTKSTKQPHSSKKKPYTHTVDVPLFGKWKAESLSLPILTVMLGGLDAFNPCAFFVLLFLLSLLVNAKSRGRMLLIGGVFVFFSGLMYFLFMAAWLNMFLWMGELRIITIIAGLIAVTFAIINIKDFFWLKQGVSLSMSDDSRSGLIKRMRGLLKASSFPSLLLGTVMLAIVANAYELLCTSGFPMVYTRVLTMRKLSTATYYLYLALYNLIYVIPLVIIVGLFTYTLGRRKLQEHEGRLLKLMSGLMMLGLGTMILVAPQQLNSAITGLSLLLLAVVLTALIGFWDRKRQAVSS